MKMTKRKMLMKQFSSCVVVSAILSSMPFTTYAMKKGFLFNLHPPLYPETKATLRLKVCADEVRELANRGDKDTIIGLEITDADQSALSYMHNFCNLTELRLPNAKITLMHLRYIAIDCPKLTLLDLSDTDVNNYKIEFITEKCSSLTELNLSNCRNITNTGIIRLAWDCPELQVLNLSGCTEVSNDAVIFLAKSCPKLTRLYLKDTKVTNFSLPYLENLEQLSYLGLPDGRFRQGPEIQECLASLYQ